MLNVISIPIDFAASLVQASWETGHVAGQKYQCYSVGVPPLKAISLQNQIPLFVSYSRISLPIEQPTIHKLLKL